ncbi:hypothetical protein ACFV5N_27640 [Streptomyces sp. NPDC059853]|uniref:hypothetical protein n=1 Tax=Streptomyces sp. NPDC059853 TaxID=3346973 RepID=UPI0036691563
MTSSMRNKRIRRAGPAAGLALILATVAGCSSDGGDNEEPIDTGGTSSPSPDAEGGEGDDEAALVALYEAYWDARVEVENSEAGDIHLLEGIVTPAMLEKELSRVRDFQSNGLYRQGGPVIENITATVDGDTAIVESCKSEEGWDIMKDGEVIPGVVPEELINVHGHVVTAEKGDGAWLITDTLPEEEGNVTCS